MMEKFRHILTQFLVLSLLQILGTQAGGRVSDPLCPPADRIAPCICRQGQGQSKYVGIVLDCQGRTMDQSAIDTTIENLRSFNGLTPSQYLKITQVNIAFTRMTQLDLSPFVQTSLNALRITHNIFLSEILGPDQKKNLNLTEIRPPVIPPELKSGLHAGRAGVQVQGQGQEVDPDSELGPGQGRAGLGDSDGKIRVRFVDFSDNALTDAGLTDALQYFYPEKLTQLNLAQNRIQGRTAQILKLQNSKNKKKASADEEDDENSSKGEFLPSLSKYSNLQTLNLSRNEIRQLGGGPFKRNNRLSTLALNHNRIGQLDKDAFLFNELPEEDTENSSEEEERARQLDLDSSFSSKTPLTILLNYNELDNTEVHPETGLETLERPVRLILERNRFNYISSRIFRGLLEKDAKSFIDLRGNPIVCDTRMKWLKKEKQEWKNRVKNAQCINDPQKNVFTSTLIK